MGVYDDMEKELNMFCYATSWALVVFFLSKDKVTDNAFT